MRSPNAQLLELPLPKRCSTACKIPGRDAHLSLIPTRVRVSRDRCRDRFYLARRRPSRPLHATIRQLGHLPMGRHPRSAVFGCGALADARRAGVDLTSCGPRSKSIRPLNCTLVLQLGSPARACGPRRRVPWRPAVSCGPVPGFSREACRPARGRARSPCGDGSGARAAGRAGPGRETGGEAGDEHRMAGLHFCFGERRVT
jgi:hypothetical protein